MNSLTEAEFNKISANVLYANRAAETKQSLSKVMQEVQKYIPNAEYIYLLSPYEQPEFSDIRIEFTQNGIRFWLHKIYKDNKYKIVAYMEQFKNTSRYDIERISDKYAKPCNMGVFTAKKINDWINYYTSIYNEIEADDTRKAQEIADFLKSIEKERVRWRNEAHTAGEIRRNGLCFSFSIETGYISQNMTFDYCGTTDYEKFRLMADNEFFPTKKY